MSPPGSTRHIQDSRTSLLIGLNSFANKTPHCACTSKAGESFHWIQCHRTNITSISCSFQQRQKLSNPVPNELEPFESIDRRVPQKTDQRRPIGQYSPPIISFVKPTSLWTYISRRWLSFRESSLFIRQNGRFSHLRSRSQDI
jgi:hypothetical protein